MERNSWPSAQGWICTFGSIFHESVNKLTNTFSNNVKNYKASICIFYYTPPVLYPSGRTSNRSKCSQHFSALT